MSKEFKFGREARAGILKGVSVLNDCVKVTLGPAGRTVLIQKSYGAPHSTKDGVSVAKEVVLEDNFENMGAQMVKEVASSVATDAGDGTTTATILAHALYSEGLKLVEAGHNPTQLKQGIDWAVSRVVDYLESIKKDVKSSEEIAQVGTISSNGDVEVGNLIARAMEEVGKEGVITLEEGRTLNTELTVANGYQFDCGYQNVNFSNNEKLEAVLEDVRVLLTDMPLNNSAVMLPIMEKYHSSEYQGKPLLVISDKVDGEALALMVINNLKKSFPCCAVKAPGFGDRKKEMLQDLAVLTGATLISDDMGHKLENFDVSWVGKARRVVVTKNNTTVVEGQGDQEEIQSRVGQIRSAVEAADSTYDKEKQQERLAKLVGGVAVISVGATTEAEMKEKKDRVEDALAATKAAVEEGVVPGGGVALLKASKALSELKVPEEYQYGVKLVQRALSAPLQQIVLNADGDPAVVKNEILSNNDVNFGFNARTQKFEDLVSAGVIDPSKVVRCALQNAASVASLMLTTDCMIVNKPKEDSGHHQMMGM